MLPVVLHVVNAMAAIIICYVGEINLLKIKIKPIVYHLTLTIVPGHLNKMVDQVYWCHQAALTMVYSNNQILNRTRLPYQQRLPRIPFKLVRRRNSVDSANSLLLSQDHNLVVGHTMEYNQENRNLILQ